MEKNKGGVWHIEPQHWDQISAMPYSNCVTSGKLLHLSGPVFPQVQILGLISEGCLFYLHFFIYFKLREKL